MDETSKKDPETEAALGKAMSTHNTLRSDMTHEIISHTPSFTEKWALLIFLAVLLIITGITWFIKYPDVIEARAKLTMANAPKEILTRSDGRLVKLFVHNNETIVENGVIGWLESTASHPEVLALSDKLDSATALISAGKMKAAAACFAKHYYNLGEIQQSYQQFIVSWQEFEDHMVNGFYPGKKKVLEHDIRSLESVQRSLQSQRELTEQDLRIAQETLEMNEALLKQNALSKDEFRNEQSRFVNKKMALPQLEITRINTETQQRDKIREIEQLEHETAKQVVLFMQGLQSLKSMVADWKLKHVLTAPLPGKVVFVIPLQENQYLPSGKLLGYVTPGENSFYAEAYLPQNNFGKIDTGMRVQLRFDAYPYQEAGFVPGKLSYISNIPSDSGFLATIKLDGLVTSNARSVSYKNGLKGSAMIITSDKRLLTRLYHNLTQSTTLGK